MARTIKDYIKQQSSKEADVVINPWHIENAGTRKLPITQELTEILQHAARAAGVDEVRIVSGGQKGDRYHGGVGSNRHTIGKRATNPLGAADLDLYRNGEKLSFSDKDTFQTFVGAAAAAGATGIGGGKEYMGDGRLHVGGGKKATWGSQAAFLASAADQGIRAYQQQLIDAGADIKADGVVGPKTRAAASKYGSAIEIAQKSRAQPTQIATRSLQTERPTVAQEFFGPSGALGTQTRLSAEDKDALARIAWAESKGESQKGQEAVAEVVLNRAFGQSGEFPTDVPGVIADTKHAQQFTPMSGKTSYTELEKPPAEFADKIGQFAESYMSGTHEGHTSGATYFAVPSGGIKSEGRFKIGNHHFGYGPTGGKTLATNIARSPVQDIGDLNQALVAAMDSQQGLTKSDALGAVTPTQRLAEIAGVEPNEANISRIEVAANKVGAPATAALGGQPTSLMPEQRGSSVELPTAPTAEQALAAPDEPGPNILEQYAMLNPKTGQPMTMDEAKQQMTDYTIGNVLRGASGAGQNTQPVIELRPYEQGPRSKPVPQPQPELVDLPPQQPPAGTAEMQQQLAQFQQQQAALQAQTEAEAAQTQQSLSQLPPLERMVDPARQALAAEQLNRPPATRTVLPLNVQDTTQDYPGFDSVRSQMMGEMRRTAERDIQAQRLSEEQAREAQLMEALIAAEGADRTRAAFQADDDAKQLEALIQAQQLERTRQAFDAPPTQQSPPAISGAPPPSGNTELPSRFNVQVGIKPTSMRTAYGKKSMARPLDAPPEVGVVRPEPLRDPRVSFGDRRWQQFQPDNAPRDTGTFEPFETMRNRVYGYSPEVEYTDLHVPTGKPAGLISTEYSDLPLAAKAQRYPSRSYADPRDRSYDRSVTPGRSAVGTSGRVAPPPEPWGRGQPSPLNQPWSPPIGDTSIGSSSQTGLIDTEVVDLPMPRAQSAPGASYFGDLAPAVVSAPESNLLQSFTVVPGNLPLAGPSKAAPGKAVPGKIAPAKTKKSKPLDLAPKAQAMPQAGQGVNRAGPSAPRPSPSLSYTSDRSRAGFEHNVGVTRALQRANPDRTDMVVGRGSTTVVGRDGRALGRADASFRSRYGR